MKHISIRGELTAPGHDGQIRYHQLFRTRWAYCVTCKWGGSSYTRDKGYAKVRADFAAHAAPDTDADGGEQP